MSGILLPRSVHLSQIANKIPGTAVLNSLIQRVRRFLNNPAVRVRDWYEPVARDLLQSQAKSSGTIRLILDGAKIGFGHQLLKAALSTYRRRMWIEELFGDFKKHGFELESTYLRHFLRLSRLTLAVSLLYVWLVSCGLQTIKNGKRSLVDRRGRKDLSVFRIGFNAISRCLTNGLLFNPACSILPSANCMVARK